MTLIDAYQRQDGAVVARVDIGSVEGEGTVSQREDILKLGDDGYDEALAFAQAKEAE